MALLRFLWFPAAIILVTLGWLWLDSAVGWRGVHLPRVGALLVLAGSLLAGWCSFLFVSRGEGTPHPFTAKTKRLVTTGPYRVVRNPMMWGVGTILAGLALWLGSVGLWLGLAGFLAFIRWFVRAYEEPDMERRFGEDYREYCLQVPRWWPRLRSG
jgi:protein-S-isoprenylcysteine O-methyltransferase Ste14